jgi:hypothetical protein
MPLDYGMSTNAWPLRQARLELVTRIAIGDHRSPVEQDAQIGFASRKQAAT